MLKICPSLLVTEYGMLVITAIIMLIGYIAVKTKKTWKITKL